MAENHRFIVAQFLTLVINNDDEAVVLILQGDPQMGIEQREAVFKILTQGSIFGRIDFIEGDIVKGNILIEVEMVLTMSEMPPPLITVLIKEVLIFSDRRIAEDCTSISFLRMGLMMSAIAQLTGILTIGNAISLAAAMTSSLSCGR